MSHHKHINTNNRRHFLRKMLGAGCASLTLSPFLSTVTNLGLLNAAAAANRPIYSLKPSSDYKALVCIMLSGGNDSYNMLIPSGSTYGSGQYTAYSDVRGNMALDQEDLLDLNPATIDNHPDLERQFGLHHSLPKVRSLFNGESYTTEEDVVINPNADKCISFIANVGTLLAKPYTLSDYNNGIAIPYQLGSHSDQIKSWHTCYPQGFGTSGWGGRLADILYETNNNQDVSMNIALNNVNMFQRGNTITEYVIKSSGGGSVKLYNSDNLTSNFYNSVKMATTQSIMEHTSQNILEQAYGNTVRKSMENSNDFYDALDNTVLNTTFPNTTLGNQLAMVAKTIANRDNIGDGFFKQTFYVNLGGFDNHNYLLSNHTTLLAQLDDALYSFYLALVELGVLDQVTTFTMSDFARTLGSNGDGTDHAWGGHHFVMGGAVDSGKIVGTYPNLASLSNLDIGNGRLIPTTSCDEYFADLAMWFGASSSDLDQILPNIGEFWIPSGTSGPLGLFV